MDNFHERFSWKVWLLILLVLAVIVLVILMIPSFFDNNTQVEEQKPKSSPVSQNNNVPFPTNITQKQERSGVKEKTYTSSYFILSYPTTWEIRQETLSGGDLSWTLKPIQDDSRKAHIIIQIYDSAKVPVERLRNIFKSLGYIEKTTKLRDEVAYNFSGSIDSIPPLHEEVYITSLNEKSYKIEFGYVADSKQQDLIDIFENVILSLRLPKVDVRFL